jgi:hypothetical protein
VSFTTSGYYTFDVVAGGDAAVGVLPEVAVVVDGTNQTSFFLTTTNMAHYQVTLQITAGTHTIGLAFLNDYYDPAHGQDRNAAFGLLTIIPQAAPQIITLKPDASRQAVVLQWQAIPGKSYKVQTASDLKNSPWQTVTNFVSNDNIASWWDTGSLSNAPPLTPAAPRRFYRILRLGP